LAIRLHLDNVSKMPATPKSIDDFSPEPPDLPRPAPGQSKSLFGQQRGYFWLTTAFNSSANGIVIVDINGAIQFLNSSAERLTGWLQSEAKGRMYSEVIQLQHSGSPLTDNLIRLSILNEAPLNLSSDLILTERNGTTHEIEAEIAPSAFTGSQFETAVFTFRDITQRKWYEHQQRQEHAIRAVERLAENTTHALNNLLTGILGNGDLLLSQQDLSPEHRERLTAMQTGALDVAAVVRQLSAISRTKFATRSEIGLNEVVRDFLPTVSALFAGPVTLKTDFADDLPKINAASGQFEQILFSLLSNARESITSTGTVCLSTHKVIKEGADHTQDANTYAAVCIRDSGVGISPENLEQIFEPFFTTKKNQGHSGLGLCISQGIIRDYHGFVEVKSEVGSGTEICFGVPAIEEDAFSYLDPVSPEESHVKTILIVEDDHAIRQLLRRILEGAGYHVVEARDGEDAMLVAGLHEGRIDILVTDVGMPGMSGPELVRQFAGVHPEAKFLLISGFSPDRIGSSAGLPRGVDFLQKPFLRKDLLARVENLL
jgi:two-component system cell cycle sensor histidine kinase/response regulator CckA